MVLPGVYVSTVPTSYVVESVVVVVTGAVVVCSVVVVLVCANASGAISAQATVMMLLFIIPSLIVFCILPRLHCQDISRSRGDRPFIVRPSWAREYSI